MIGKYFIFLFCLMPSLECKNTKNTENDIIAGEYFIALKEVDDSSNGNNNNAAMKEFADKVKSEYGLTLKRYSFKKLKLFFVEATEEDIAPLRFLPEVDYIEENKVITSDSCIEEHLENLWGLDRIDQRQKVSDGPTGKYTYSPSDDGHGVIAYVVDSGMDINLPEFEGRASFGFVSKHLADDSEADTDGHGTHVGGIIGAVTYGVAKKVNLVAVKVLNQGAGSLKTIVGGLDWVEADYKKRTATGGGIIRAVVNLSIGGGVSKTFDKAVKDLIAGGIIVVTSAGNDNTLDACDQSPGRVPDVITVAGTKESDDYFGSFGPCVDLFAPGYNIISTWPTDLSVSGVQTISGTSMSAPFVAGVIARWLSTKPSSQEITVVDVKAWLMKMGTTGALDLTGNYLTTPNTYLYMNCFENGGWDFNG